MARLTGQALRRHERELEEARERRRALEAAHPPRALNVDKAAVQRRDEIAAAILSYYEFLTTFYLPAESLKRPPSGGWPSITAERLAFLNKTDEAIDILKHIPYISGDENGRESHQIYELCVCNDYTGRRFERAAVDYQSREAVDPVDFMDDERSPVPKLKTDAQHVITLARSAVSDAGHHMFLDTRDATVVLVEFIDGDRSPDASVQECMEDLKCGFRDLDVFPTAPDDVHFQSKTWLSKAQFSQVKETFLKHGWPGDDYRKEQCMVAIKELWDEFLRQAKAERED